MRAEDGKRGEALKLLEQAVTALTPAIEADPQNRSTRIEAASAWYELGKRARRDHKTQQAVDALSKVPALMDAKLLGGEPSTQEQFLIARSRLEQGLSQRDLGRIDDAMKTIFDSMESLVKLVEKSAPKNQEQALTLGEAYVEFGEIVAGKLGGTDAKEAQTEAMSILMELVRQHPQWNEPRFLLAKCYGDMANIERDLGNAAEANRRQGAAVQTLTEIGKTDPTSTRYQTEMARQKGQHAQLLCDTGKARDGVPLARDAVSLLEELIKQDDAALDELDRKACGVLLAQNYGILGHTSEIAKDSKLAKASFSKASAQWEKLKAAHGDDEVIQQGLNWTKDRLAKFR